MSDSDTGSPAAGKQRSTRDGDLALAAAELQDLLLSSQDFDEFLQYLASYAAEAVGPDLWCGVTAYRAGRPFTVASSHAAAMRVDEAQYSSGDGPCMHSIRADDEVLVADLAAEHRWPHFLSVADELGVRSSLSLPLRTIGGGAEGALNLYAHTTHAFGPGERARARHLAHAASRVLTLALRLANHVAFTEQLQAALASRAVIDQAMGIIMAQNRCDADEAFAILRAASQNRNLRLQAVAADIVTAVTGKPPRPGPRLTPPATG